MNPTQIYKYNLNTDLNNKSMRLPVCFCIEVGKDTLFHIISEDMNKFFRKINADPSLAASVEVAVVTFSADKVRVVRSFKPIAADTLEITDEEATGAPDLNAAILQCIKMAQERKCDYNNASLNYSQPSIILFASGNYSCDISEATSRINGCAKKGTLKVYPMMTKEKNIDELKRLSSDGKVYVSLDGTYSSLFDKIGKSMRRLSDSTSRAFESLHDAAPEEWDRLVRM